jgi:hypothetical protein
MRPQAAGKGRKESPALAGLSLGGTSNVRTAHAVSIDG